MRTRLLVIVIGGSFVVLAAWSLQLGATPALAQTTCQTGQTYCPSGTYAGQCRPNTVTCPTGSVSATVGGCSTCSCPGGQIVCGGACQATRTCSDPNRATTDQCTGACGACTGDLSLDATTNTCVETIVKLAPTSTQERSSITPTISVVQKGSGLLFNLQAQSGADDATRRQIISVDKSGIMVGYDPDAAKLGIDLSAAGGQNLLYAIARAMGLDAALDSLLKLQVKETDGTIRDRFRIDGSGNVVAAGSVRGSQLCIGADCKNSWNAVAPAGVLLQNTTPGTQQAGHLNISGTARLGSLAFVGGSVVNLQDAQVANTTYIGGGGTPSAPPFLRFTGGDLVYAPLNEGERGFIVGDSAVDQSIVRYAKLWHDGVGAYLGDTGGSSQAIRVARGNVAVPGSLTVSGDVVFSRGLQVGSGGVGIIDTTGKIPALSSTYLANLSGANLTSLNASNITSGTVPDARLPVNLMRTTYDAGASNPGPWVTLQGGASVPGNIALRLFDGGTADGNVNILEFAYSGGSGPMLGAKIRSTSVGTNMASGAKLTLETTSNNAGTLNTNQLVLDRDGNVGIGVADPAERLDVSGDVTATGDFTGKNTYECVNVGSELRCNLRQYWRTADKTSGYVESWVGSDTCTNICTRAGLKACSDIQYNWECPNGTLTNSAWYDDDPGEFGAGGRTCYSSTEYRESPSGTPCAGQAGATRHRFRCRCQG